VSGRRAARGSTSAPSSSSPSCTARRLAGAPGDPRALDGPDSRPRAAGGATGRAGGPSPSSGAPRPLTARPSAARSPRRLTPRRLRRARGGAARPRARRAVGARPLLSRARARGSATGRSRIDSVMLRSERSTAASVPRTSGPRPCLWRSSASREREPRADEARRALGVEPSPSSPVGDAARRDGHRVPSKLRRRGWLRHPP